MNNKLIVPKVTESDLGVYRCKTSGTALQRPPMIQGSGISEFVSEPITVYSDNVHVHFINSDTSIIGWDPPVLLTAEPKGGTFSGTGVTDSIFSPSGLNEGIYNIVYAFTTDRGCSISDTLKITVGPEVSAAQFKSLSGIKTFPNPTTRFLQIQGEQFAGYELHDNMGRLVAKSSESIIDFINFKEGIYVVKLMDDKGNYYSKKVMYLR